MARVTVERRPHTDAAGGNSHGARSANLPGAAWSRARANTISTWLGSGQSTAASKHGIYSVDWAPPIQRPRPAWLTAKNILRRCGVDEEGHRARTRKSSAVQFCQWKISRGWQRKESPKQLAHAFVRSHIPTLLGWQIDNEIFRTSRSDPRYQGAIPAMASRRVYGHARQS